MGSSINFILIDMNPRPTLKTERLVLRPFTLDDAKQVQKLAGDRQIASTTLNIPHPYEDGMAEVWIGNHEEGYQSGKGVTFAITLKENGELVGAISIMSIVEKHQGELGYWVGVPYWNKGYCTEAARKVLRYGFMEKGLNRIHACHLSRNHASGRVMEKLGMSHEGTRKQHIRKWEVFEDMELRGILRSEWRK